MIIFTAVLGFLFASLGLGATSALAEGETLQGTLINASQPRGARRR